MSDDTSKLEDSVVINENPRSENKFYDVFSKSEIIRPVLNFKPLHPDFGRSEHTQDAVVHANLINDLYSTTRIALYEYLEAGIPNSRVLYKKWYGLDDENVELELQMHVKGLIREFEYLWNNGDPNIKELTEFREKYTFKKDRQKLNYQDTVFSNSDIIQPVLDFKPTNDHIGRSIEKPTQDTINLAESINDLYDTTLATLTQYLKIVIPNARLIYKDLCKLDDKNVEFTLQMHVKGLIREFEYLWNNGDPNTKELEKFREKYTSKEYRQKLNTKDDTSEF